MLCHVCAGVGVSFDHSIGLAEAGSITQVELWAGWCVAPPTQK